MPNFDFSKLQVPPDCAERMGIEDGELIVVTHYYNSCWRDKLNWWKFKDLQSADQIRACRDAQIGWWREIDKIKNQQVNGFEHEIQCEESDVALRRACQQIRFWRDLERSIE
jgi:hypothetical protein